jgi:serine/threonine-protein kinase
VGWAQVYVGHDRSLDRRVAIKVLPDELATQPDLQERFVREARAQAQLNSPHVVHIYYIGHTPAASGETGSLFFAMELVEGGALENVLDGGEKLDAERARKLMIQVARGLRDAEAAGIIHRDIKPSNLLVDRNGDIKIADFGVAKPIRQRDSKITQEGAVVGSPLYMAPEQARGEAVDHRADMYSLGCTFYHLLSGAPPFDGPTPIVVVSKHLTATPAPLSEVAAARPAQARGDRRALDGQGALGALRRLQRADRGARARSSRGDSVRGFLGARCGSEHRCRAGRNRDRAARLAGARAPLGVRHRGARGVGADRRQVPDEPEGAPARTANPWASFGRWLVPWQVCGCRSWSAW